MRSSILLFVLVSCVTYGGVDAATSYVYDNSLQSPFQDWSWGNAVNRACTTPTHNASASSISLSPNQYYALYLHAAKYISTASYSSLTFWAYRPTGASTNIIFNMIVDGANGAVPTGPTKSLLSVLAGGAWPENTWTQGTISFGDYPAGTYDGFFWQDNSGATTNPTVYFDDIALVSGGAAPTTTTAAPTSAPTQKPVTTSAPTVTTTTTTTKAPVSTTTTTKAPATTAPPTTTAKPATTTTSSGTVSANGDPDVLALYSSVTTGTATYYGQYSNGGACMLDPTPDAGAQCMHTVAIANFMNSKTCGMCVQVTGQGQGSGNKTYAVTGTRTVFVNDQCPNCPIGLLDFGLNGDGAWNITWKAVPCPITSKIQYVFKSGSSASWAGIQPRNTIYPVYKFSVYVGGAWTDVPRLSYNYFVSSFSGLTFPLQIKMTSVKGEVLTDTIQSLQNGVIIAGNVQFTP